MTQYDAKLEQARMAIADEWVRTIMRPILASGMIDNVTRLAALDDGHDMEWILGALASETQCAKCEGYGKIDCPKCDGTGEYPAGKACNGDCDGDCQVDCPADDCDDGQIQLGEIFEYWIVDERAGRRLEEAGETMIAADDIGIGSPIWCRRTTGQGIGMDWVVMCCAESSAFDCPRLLADVNADHVAYWRAKRTYTIRGSEYARSWPGYRDTVVTATSADHAWILAGLDVERAAVTITLEGSNS